VYQADIYDVAVVPKYQGQGIGSTIIQHILRNVPNCNVILYAAPGKEHFYSNLGFRTMKTGMVLFQHPEWMSEKGFTDEPFRQRYFFLLFFQATVSEKLHIRFLLTHCRGQLCDTILLDCC
jgi:GNAT superfamily N-acetyltransferase